MFDSYIMIRYSAKVRTAYRCRAYPDEAQQQVLARTFGCVRVVWNRTLAAGLAVTACGGDVRRAGAIPGATAGETGTTTREGRNPVL